MMNIVKFSVLIAIFIVLIGQIRCGEGDDDDDVAKVTEINGDASGSNNNSAITHIRYANNGNFVSSPQQQQRQQQQQHRIAAYDQQMIGQCGGIFRNLQNEIASPKFISAHPICALRCEYQIISPYVCENEFHVQFLEFSIDDALGCERDRVIINREDELCGKVVGVKKYRTKGGILNITFSSTSWDSTEKGFRLLITRLPCVDDTNANQTEMDSSTEPLPPPPTTTDGALYHVNASYAVDSPNYETQHPIYGTPYGYNLSQVELNNRQDIPVEALPTPAPPPPPIFPPPTIFPPPPVFPPFPQLPHCCRNLYNQQRFLMLSQGFPAHTVLNNDCLFVIHKSSPSACRLRIQFKYFLLDEQPGQFGCQSNFIEIDGQRICGCKTNFVFETQFGAEPKIIRLHTTPGTHFAPQGFVLDVEQLDCPFKLQQPLLVRDKRTILTKLLLKKHFMGSHMAHIPPHRWLPPQPLPEQHVDFDDDDAFRGKFFNVNGHDGGFVSAQCSINHLRLLHVKLESLGVFKHFCLPFF